MWATANSHAVGTDPAGNSVVAWIETAGPNATIWAQSFVGPSGWTAPAVVRVAPLSARNLDLSIKANGTAFLVWGENLSANTTVWAARFQSGSGWDPAVRLSVENSNLAPRVAADPSGRATAVWTEGAVTARVYSSTFAGNWTPAAAISANPPNASYVVDSPAVGMDGAGNAIAVWRGFDGVRYSVYASRYLNGSWGGPGLIEFDNTSDAQAPELAVDPLGGAVVAWSQFDGTFFNLLTNHYSPGAGWWGVAAIESSAGNATAPKVGVANSEDAVVVWLESDGTRNRVFANRFRSGFGWLTAEALDPVGPGAPTGQQLAVAANGDALAAWIQLNGSRPSALSNRLSASVGWGGPRLLENDNASNVTAIEISLTPYGEGMATWGQGVGPISLIWSSLSFAFVPTAPTAVTTVPSNGQVRLTWNAPASDGGAPVTGYSVYRGIPPANATFLMSVSGSRAFNDTNVTNGVTYEYRVAALTAIGEGPLSGVVNATPVGPPSSPSGLSAAVGPGQVSLNWFAPSSTGGYPVSEYRIYRGLSAGAESYLATTATALTFLDANVTDGTSYFYQVSAASIGGEGPRSAEIVATPRGPPGAPQGLAAAPGTGGIGLTWAAPSTDGGSTVTGYLIYRGTDSATVLPIDSIGAVASYFDSQAAAGISQFYRVSARNAFGEGPLGSASNALLLGVPSAPAGLTAASAPGEVRLHWNAPTSNGGAAVTGYQIYRGAPNSSLSLIGTTTGATDFIDVGSVSGVASVYQVTALNSVGESPPSSGITATAAPPPDITSPTVTIDTPPAGSGPLASPVTFSGSFVDDRGVSQVFARVDGGSWILVASPSQASGTWQVVIPLDGGPHTVEIRMVDSAGNMENSTVTVQIMPPADQPFGPFTDRSSEPLTSDEWNVYALAAVATGSMAAAGAARYGRKPRKDASLGALREAYEKELAEEEATANPQPDAANDFVVRAVVAYHSAPAVICKHVRDEEGSQPNKTRIGEEIEGYLRNWLAKKGEESSADVMWDFLDGKLWLVADGRIALGIFGNDEPSPEFEERAWEVVRELARVYGGPTDGGKAPPLDGADGLVEPLWARK